MIKVITGVRRCGKSYLLFNLFYNHLVDSGVPKENIIAVPLDDVDGVVSVHKDCSNTTIKYDLQGRRLTQKPAKGVYIQDGKKVMVK